MFLHFFYTIVLNISITIPIKINPPINLPERLKVLRMIFFNFSLPSISLFIGTSLILNVDVTTSVRYTNDNIFIIPLVKFNPFPLFYSTDHRN